MRPACACAVPRLRAGARPACYNRAVASRSQTEQQQSTGVDIGEVLKELENKVERLKVLYEQYFMGIEKMEPQVARKEVTRTMLTLQQQYIRNTAMRFKFNTMLQKWQIYVTYWNRVLREIENGTYVRHLQKAKRKAEQQGRELPAEMRFEKIRPPSGQFSIDEDTSESHRPKFHDHETGKNPPPEVHDDLEEVWDRLVSPTDPKRPSSPAPAPGRAPSPSSSAPAPGSPPSRPSPPPVPGAANRPPTPPPPPTAAMLPKIPGMTDHELRSLHQRYVDAQKASGAAASVKYETLVNSLAKQVPGVLSRPGVKGVRFDVTVENGKPILKAIPKK